MFARDTWTLGGGDLNPGLSEPPQMQDIPAVRVWEGHESRAHSKLWKM